MNVQRRKFYSRFLQIVSLGLFAPMLLIADPEQPEISLPLTNSIYATNALPTGVAATVNDVPIYESQVQARIAPLEERLKGQYLTNYPKLFETKLAELRKDALDEMINRESILAEFKRTDGRLDDEEMQKHLDEFIYEKIKNDYYGDTNKFLKTLAAEKITLEELRLQHARDDVVKAFYQHCVNGAPVPTAFEVETYYLENPKEFTQPEAMEVSLIIIPKVVKDSNVSPESQRKLADDIHDRVVKGGDFAMEANRISGNTNGGYRGWVERKILRKEIEDAVFALQPTNVTEVVDVPDNFFIARVSGHRLVSRGPLAESREMISKKLTEQAKSETVKKELDAVRASSVIRIVPPPQIDANRIPTSK